MPTRVVVDDDEQQIQDLIKEMRRLRSRLATTAVKGTHDEFTAAATPATTYALTYIPLTGTCLMALNGHVQREGTDYTCDYTTGIVTVAATQAASDKITFRYLVTDWLIARSLPADGGGPLLAPVQQSSAPTRGAATLSITNTLPAAVTAGNLVVVLYWNASGDAVNNTVSGLSATWTNIRAGGLGMALAVAPGGGTTVTLSIGATRTMAMMVYEFSPSQAIVSITGGINSTGGAPPPQITTDTITAAQTVLDMWLLVGNTTAPTSYDDALPALTYSRLTQANDATDVIQFGGAYPTAAAAGNPSYRPHDPTAGVTLSGLWQLVIT